VAREVRGAISPLLEEYALALRLSKTNPVGTLADLAEEFAHLAPILRWCRQHAGVPAALKRRSDELFAAIVCALRGALVILAARYGAAPGAEIEPADVIAALRQAVARPLVGRAPTRREIAGRIRGLLQGEQRKLAARGAGQSDEYDDDKAAAESPNLDRQLDAKRASARLRGPDKALLLASAVYGFTSEELAEQLGISNGRLRNKLTEARGRARQALDEDP
jgi:hypothetical protein